MAGKQQCFPAQGEDIMVPRNTYHSEHTNNLNRKFSTLLIAAFLLNCLLILGSNSPVSAQVGGKKPQTIELEASSISDSQIRLRWRINNPDIITGIRIYRAHYVTPDNFVFLTSLPPNALSYIDSGLKAKSTWLYRIQTQDRKPAMLSAPSNAARATTLTAGSGNGTSSQNPSDEPKVTNENPTLGSVIQTLTAKALSANEVELRWAIPSLTHVASIRIFRASSDDPKNFVMVGAIGSNLNRYVDADLKPRTTYYYHMKYNQNSHSANLSAPSNTAMATTPDGADPNPRKRYEGLRPKPGISFDLPAGGIGSAIPMDDMESEFLYFLNKYRAARGVGPVRASISLTMAADSLSKDLAPRNEVSKYDSNGFGLFMRARAFQFPKLEETKFDTLSLSTRIVDLQTFFELTIQAPENREILLRPEWKVVGIARAYNNEGTYYWVLDFADYWDKTIPLPGEDTDGRVDGNERVRTRPPADALAAKAKFSGYGDDGKPYSPVHCDLETKECWRDPAPAGNRSLRENSLPENMVGHWHVEYQVNSKGVVHFNSPDKFDMTDFTMSLLINEDGTWVSQGYKTYQDPVPAEAGTWKWVHDAGRDEEIITFFRDNGKAAATFRVHAAPGVMTFYVVDGGDFFQGVKADGNPKDDPYIIFLPGTGFFYTPAPSFPTAMRCNSCPQTQP